MVPCTRTLSKMPLFEPNFVASPYVGSRGGGWPGPSCWPVYGVLHRACTSPSYVGVIDLHAWSKVEYGGVPTLFDVTGLRFPVGTSRSHTTA